MNTLAQGAPYYIVFRDIEPSDCFFEVAHSTVNHLRGCAGSARRKVACFEQDRLQPTQLGIESAAGAGSAAADDANVEGLFLDGAERHRAAFHAGRSRRGK